MRVLKRDTQTLSCALTPLEFEKRAKSLADSIEAYNIEVELQNATKADMKAKLADMARKRDELARVVSRRAEDRVVDVELLADDVKGTVCGCRSDTGEYFDERPMRAEERQLAFDDAPARPSGIESVTLTAGGRSVTATPEQMRAALDTVKASRGRAAAKH